MSNSDRLGAAYGADNPAALETLYRDWAATYDDGFASKRGYRLPLCVARAFADAATPQDTPVLDVGAGTGLVGQGLAALADWTLDALDPSVEMLAIAKRLNVYRALHAKPLEAAPQGFGGVVSAGTFTHGHLGAGMLVPFVNCLRKSGLAVLSINQAHFETAGFADALAQLPIRNLTQTQTRIYDTNNDTGDGHGNDTALIVTFRKA